jgi:hypothetical protein
MFDHSSIINFDNLRDASNKVTYCNNSLDRSSFIDHFFVSSDLKPLISAIALYDSAANLSDHRTVTELFNFNIHDFRGVTSNQPLSEPKHYACR